MAGAPRLESESTSGIGESLAEEACGCRPLNSDHQSAPSFFHKMRGGARRHWLKASILALAIWGLLVIVVAGGWRGLALASEDGPGYPQLANRVSKAEADQPWATWHAWAT